MSLSLVEDITHDVLKWAEAKYLDYVDITLVNKSTSKPVQAVRFKVDENGKAVQSDRAGSNDWQNINDTYRHCHRPIPLGVKSRLNSRQ